MGWIPGWPTDPVAPKGSLTPVAVTLHRTYGGWGGDYSVGKNQGLFQFLIGQDDGQYVQFMETTSVAYHCNGANFKSFGVELTGTNEDALTAWQVAKLGEVLRYASSEHGIPLVYQDPVSTPPASIHVNDGNFRGVISHVSVMTDDGSSQHTDLVTVADFNAAIQQPGPTPTPTGDDDVTLYKITGSDGNYVLHREAAGILIPLTAQETMKYTPGIQAGWVHEIDWGGDLDAVSFNQKTVHAQEAAVAAFGGGK